MKNINPPKVYVTESVMESDLCVKRLNRMMESIHARDVECVNDAQLDEIFRINGWNKGGRRTGETNRSGDPYVIFNTFRWLTEAEEKEAAAKYPSIANALVRRGRHYGFRDKSNLRSRHDIVCQSAYEIHTAFGCLHACAYCHVGEYLNVMLNLEEFVERLEELVRQNPWQKLYKYDNMSDTISLEPEYGASALLSSYFARQDDKYLMLYTKSDNVEHLLKLDHKGHTIFCCTVSCDTVSRVIERGTPTMEQRIEALRRCQDAGYPVRVRFSPIIPIKGWREENREMIEKLFAEVKPDVVAIWVLCQMSADQVKRSFGISGAGSAGAKIELDERYLQAMEEFSESGQARAYGLFPHEARAEIYEFFIDEIKRISPTTPVALCLETSKMWDVFGTKLGMSPEDYVCCCGPTSTPGNPMFERVGE